MTTAHRAAARRALRWADLPLRIKGLVVVAIPLVPLVVATAMVHYAHGIERSLNADLSRMMQVRTSLDAVLMRLVDAETAVRGYLLTADRSFLVPYDVAQTGLPGELASLDALVVVPSQRERLMRLRTLADERLGMLQKVAQSVDREGRLMLPDIRSSLLVTGNRLTEQVREEIARMRDDESAILAAREATVRRAESLSLLMVSLGAACGLVGGVVAMMLFTLGVSRRIEAVAANASRLAARQPLLPVAATADEVGCLAVRLQEAADLLAEYERARAVADAALRDSAARIHDLYDQAPCGYHSLDVHGRVVAMNQTELDWLGYTRDEVTGLSFGDLLTPASGVLFGERFAMVRETGVLRDAEFELQAKDGRILPVSVSASVVRSPAGEFIATRSSVFDITERRRAEQDIRRLNAVLEERVQHEKILNHELESFSYSVSHDLRAPLRHVVGFGALLERRMGDQFDMEGRRLLSRITLAATRMGRLIDDLLVFSRMGRAEMCERPVDLGPLVTDVRQEVTSEVAGRELTWVIHPLPQVHGDPAMLRLAFVNLLSNAVKYTAPRPHAQIEIGSPSGHNGQAVVYVRDNGVGFDMKYVDKLFGVFQRLHTSSEFEGTGIGLANVRRIVERHGGHAWAESVLDQGATFYVSLPTQAAEVHS